MSIGFTPHSVFADNRFWEDEKIYVELARQFHFRKIKNLEISQGITEGEFVRFASKITRPLKEYIKEGGARNILKKENIPHISVEELDYSQLLKGEGEEIKDIWPFLLMEAVEQADSQKLDQVAESFERVIGKYNTEDLIQNEELQKNFSEFFKYLRNTAEDKHRACAKNLLKNILAAKKTPPESKIENLKLLISDLSEEDMASTLWEKIIGDEKFDSLSFSVFSKIIAKERHLKISTSLRELFQADDPQNRKPDVEKKIRSLLSATSGQFMSEIYRQTLAHLLSEIPFEKKMDFDPAQLYQNYRFILLNILDRQTLAGPAAASLERILEEWKRIAQEKDLSFLKCLLEVLQKKEPELAGETIYQKARTSLSELVESLILQEEHSKDLEDFIPLLKVSVFDRKVYLDRIFGERAVTPTLLRAFFGFFTQYMFDFDARLKQNAPDLALQKMIVDSLKPIDSPISLVSLKNIYLNSADPKTKTRALKAMGSISDVDEKFLFGILGVKDASLKGEALVLLMRNDRNGKAALDRLLDIPSPYGFRNKTLIGHIRIVEEKNVLAAASHLKTLTRRQHFWNRRVRQEAARVLEKWSEG